MTQKWAKICKFSKNANFHYSSLLLPSVGVGTKKFFFQNLPWHVLITLESKNNNIFPKYGFAVVRGFKNLKVVCPFIIFYKQYIIFIIIALLHMNAYSHYLSLEFVTMDFMRTYFWKLLFYCIMVRRKIQNHHCHIITQTWLNFFEELNFQVITIQIRNHLWILIKISCKWMNHLMVIILLKWMMIHNYMSKIWNIKMLFYRLMIKILAFKIQIKQLVFMLV